MNPLTLAYSSCPNDTYIFHAMVHGCIDTDDLTFRTTIADVETLNQKARHAAYDITKLSFAAMAGLGNRYRILRSGAALGRGCGPLVISRHDHDFSNLDAPVIAVPGLGTTACLLFRFYLKERFPRMTPQLVPMPFEQIMPAVAKNRADLGVIIHEGRFVYEKSGFKLIQDLGQWWENNTGLPIPLGCIAVKKEMPTATARRVEALIRQSIMHARTCPDDGAAYIRSHAQELADDVIRDHIGLYVNDFSMDLGTEGEKAVTAFFEKARDAGIISRAPENWFVN